MKDAIIETAGAILTLATLGFIFFMIALILFHGQEQLGAPPVQDEDFEEFYLDLHRYSIETDFSRKEAEELYKVWQGQSNSRIVETRKGETNWN